MKDNLYDADQPNTKHNHANDPLEVPIGPITRDRAKKLKEALNELVQNIWSKMDLEGLGTFKEHVTFNSSSSGPRRAQFVWNKRLMCPAQYQPCFFS
jgi:hypothetical protein